MKQTTYQKLLKWLIYITPVAGATVVQIPSAVITDETDYLKKKEFFTEVK